MRGSVFDQTRPHKCFTRDARLKVRLASGICFMCVNGAHRSVAGAVCMLLACTPRDTLPNVEAAVAHVQGLRPQADFHCDDGRHTTYTMVAGLNN